MTEQSRSGGAVSSIPALRQSKRRRESQRILESMFMFFAFVIMLGLLNILVVVAVGLLDGKSIDFTEILSDGGLFFYAITLLGGSIYGLHGRREELRWFYSLSLVIFFVIYGGALIVTTLNDQEYYSRTIHSFSPPMKNIVWWEVFSTAVAVLVAVVATVSVECLGSEKAALPTSTEFETNVS